MWTRRRRLLGHGIRFAIRAGRQAGGSNQLIEQNTQTKSPPKRAFAESNRPTDDAALVLLQIVQDLAEQAWRVRGPLWDLKRLPSQSPIGHLGYCKQKCCRRPPPIAPPQE